MPMTVAALHKRLGELIVAGHGRKPVVVKKQSFHHACEDDGVTMLDLYGVEDPRWVYTCDDDGGVKINKDGTEAGRRQVILYGSAKDRD